MSIFRRCSKMPGRDRAGGTSELGAVEFNNKVEPESGLVYVYFRCGGTFLPFEALEGWQSADRGK